MVNKIIAILHLVSFLICIFGVAIFLGRAAQLIGEIDVKRQRLANFIPFIALSRNSYTEDGKQHYDSAIKGLKIASLGLIGLLTTIYFG